MITLANFWAAVLGLSILLYAVLDGFDLGVGILFGFTGDDAERRHMLAAISPVWDGNETWLVVFASTLFAAFPAVYALMLSAFYLPLSIMLAALILRGVAFEFREKASPRMRGVWDAGFAGGSLAATFMQGAMVGALVNGFTFGPFAALCGIGLCIGHALLGAAWLTMKSEGQLRERCYRAIPRLLAGVMVFLACALAASLAMQLRVMDRWIERPWLALFPAIGLAAVLATLTGVRRRSDAWPFAGAVAIFVAAFATFAASFLPYMVPFSITIDQAAAPRSSLAFIFWGAGVFVLPLMLAYTVTAYAVFKGKVPTGAGYH